MRVNNHIRSAVGKLSQHRNLSHDCLITNDFGQLIPVMALPLLPRDKFKISCGVFSRVAPMIFPAYGSCDVVTNFHSVTYSQVWRDFDIFVSGQRFRGTSSINFPVISLFVITSLYVNLTYTVEADSNYDLVTYGADGTVTYRRLTLFGRFVRKVLTVLGYPFVSELHASDISNTRYVSALPLLSFFKIYSDFYESRQYSSTSVLRALLNQAYNGEADNSNFVVGSPVNGVSTIELTETGISSFFSFLKLLYESDYFTSAQSFPNLVGGSTALTFNTSSVGVGSPFPLTSPLNQGGAVRTGVNSENRFDQQVVASSVSQTSPMHRLLDNFENLVRRFNLVGSREIDRIRSLFGIKPSVSSQQYSVFLKSFSSHLQVQDVTSTSAEPSVDNYLGSYAGKGIISNGSTFEVDSSDYGILIGISFIKVRPIYNPGLSREVLKTSYTGYYNPEFDHGYSMALAVGEVQTKPQNSTSIDTLFNVFGFQQAFDEYRYQPSRAYGDFLDSDLLAFSFVRDNIGISAQTDSVIYHDKPYNDEKNTQGVADGIYSEFQRVFVDGSGRDHFYLYYNFEIDGLRPVRTSSECFDLGVGSVSTSNNPVI